MSDLVEFHEIIDLATAELRSNLYAIDAAAIPLLLENIHRAGKIGIYGVGREGLAMKGFAMRLYHMGLRSFVVGEMTAASVGSGDVLLVSAGPGYFSTVSALSSEAQRCGKE